MIDDLIKGSVTCMRSKVGDVDGFAWVLKNRLDGFPIEDAAPRFSDETIRIEKSRT